MSRRGTASLYEPSAALIDSHSVKTSAQGGPLSAANVSEGPTLPKMVQAAQASLPQQQSVDAMHGDKAFDSRANRICCRLKHLRCNVPE